MLRMAIITKNSLEPFKKTDVYRSKKQADKTNQVQV